MAHVQIKPVEGGAVSLVINGVDYSNEVFRDDLMLVNVGHSEVGLRVTFALSELDLADETDVPVTDHFDEVAQRVESMLADVTGRE